MESVGIENRPGAHGENRSVSAVHDNSQPTLGLVLGNAEAQLLFEDPLGFALDRQVHVVAVDRRDLDRLG